MGGRKGTLSRSLGGATILRWLDKGDSRLKVLLPSLYCPCRRCRSSLMSPWYLCPAQNWKRLVLGSAPSAWCSAHAPIVEGLALGFYVARGTAE